MTQKHPLAVWRKSQNPIVTQDDFAGRLGMKRWTIAAIEAGLRNPSVKMARRISDETDIPMGDLLPELAKEFSGEAA